LYMYYRAKHGLHKLKNDWEKAIKTINVALKKIKTPNKRNTLLLEKAKLASERSDSLLALDALENIDPHQLSEMEKKDFYVLRQRSLIQRKKENEAFDFLVGVLPEFTGKPRTFLVISSFRCYPTKKIQLAILRESLRLSRKDGITVEEVVEHSMPLMEIMDDIDIEDVKKDLDLLFLYGYCLSSKSPKEALAILQRCQRRKFSPQYIAQYVIAVIHGVLGNAKKYLSYAQKAYELCREDPFVTQEYISSLIVNREFELAENLLKSLSKSIYWHVSDIIHNQIMCLLIAKEDYESAEKEIKRWALTSPLKKYDQIALAGMHYLNERFDQCTQIAEQIASSGQEDEGHTKVAKALTDISKEHLKALKMREKAIHSPDDLAKLDKSMADQYIRGKELIKRYLKHVYVEWPFSKFERLKGAQMCE